MTISSNDIWRQIRKNELASESQCQQWQSQLTADTPDSEWRDGLKLLKKLIDFGKLTNYQARILAGQSKEPLRRGKWLILGRVSSSIWKDWVEVRFSSGSMADSRSAPSSELEDAEVFWARWLNAEQVNHLGGAKSLIARGKLLSRVRSKLIQRCELPMIEDNRLLLRVHPLSGLPLSQTEVNALRNNKQVERLVHDLFSAVATLHEMKIVHGRVMPDRIFWDSNERLSLACEPTEPLQENAAFDSVNDSVVHRLLREDLRGLSAEAFTAPELLSGTLTASFASDVYSTAITAKWLWSSSLPTEGGGVRETPRGFHSQTAVTKLNEDSTTTTNSALWADCLQRCLSKEPSRRYSNAAEFLKDVEEKSRVSIQSSNAAPQERIARTLSIQRKKTKTTLFLPLMASCGFLALALVLVMWSVVLTPSHDSADADAKNRVSNELIAQPGERNPLLLHYQLVDRPDIPWAPPSPPQPLDLELLPPGAQLIVSIQPHKLLQQASGKALIELLRQSWPLANWLEELMNASPIQIEEMQRLTMAMYSSKSNWDVATDSSSRSFQEQEATNSLPEIVLRIELKDNVDWNNIRERWGLTENSRTGQHGLLTLRSGRAVISAFPNRKDERADRSSQTQIKSMNVTPIEHPGGVLSIGSVELMEEVVELAGSVGPLNPQMKKLLEQSNADYDFCLLVTPRFLFTDGKTLLQSLPARMQQWMEQLMGRESRALLVQSNTATLWYWEVQAIGSEDTGATQIAKNWSLRAMEASSQAEAELLSGSPHPYWRALAIRWPQMLRLWQQHARFGVEDGRILANGYLPPEATSNLLLGTWLSFQEFLESSPNASISLDASIPDIPGVSAGSPPPEMTKPFDIENFLKRPVRLSFEQEPIEKALAMIAEEANDGIDPDTYAVRFDLDGTAFENSGLTRNQQIRNYRFVDGSLREALTELVRRGNPTANLTDTTDARQQLVWIVDDDPVRPDRPMILLTTRTHAEVNNLALPVEFLSSSR